MADKSLAVGEMWMNGSDGMLRGIRIVDLGTGLAMALTAKYLFELGAQVTRVEQPSDSNFDRIYPAHAALRSASEAELVAADDHARLAQALADADICLIGGEDDSDQTERPDVDAIAAAHPQLVILHITGYPADVGMEGPANGLLAQARCGLVYEQLEDRPIVYAFQPADFGAMLWGVIGLLAALYQREGSGQGQVVRTSLFEAAMSWASTLWLDVERPQRSTTSIPMSPFPLLFPASDDTHIHLAIAAPGSKYKMYRALQIDDPSVTPDSPSMPSADRGPRDYFGDYDVLAEAVARQPSGDLLASIWSAGLPAEPVLMPGACWSNPQVVHNRIIRELPDGTRVVGLPIETRSVPIAGAGPRSVAMGERPLSGVKVIDLGMYIAGPLASTVLADLGADVVKVEPVGGDPCRSMTRVYNLCNRGKKSVVIDMKDAVDRDRLFRMIGDADVVISNFRAGVTNRLGIAPEDLHAIRPDLIVLESPAYGCDGPLSQRAGFDFVIQALAGHEYRAGGEGNAPIWYRCSIADFATALVNATGALVALYHRARTGSGATIQSALLNGGVFLLSDVVEKAGAIVGHLTLNGERTGFRAAEALYRTRDEWVAIVVRNGTGAAALGEVLGIVLPPDPINWSEAEADVIGQACLQWDAAALLEALEARGVWSAKCERGMEKRILNDPLLAERGIVRVTRHPEFGVMKELGVPFSLSASVLGTDTPLARLDEHKTHYA